MDTLSILVDYMYWAPAAIANVVFQYAKTSYIAIFCGNDDSSESLVSYERLYLPQNNWRWLPWQTISRYGAVATFFNNTIFLLGGFKKSCDVLPLSTDSKWETKGKLIETRYFPAHLAKDNRVYLFGGMDHKGGILRTGEVYDCIEHKATLLSTQMPNAKYHFGSCGVGNRLFFFGGTSHGKTLLDSCEFYDITTSTFQSIPPMQSPRKAPAAAGYRNCVYVFGGDDRSDVSTLECYEIDKQQWTSLPALPGGRTLATASFLDDAMYICGGSNGTNLEKCFKYHPNTKRWSQLQSMKVKRSSHTACVVEHL